MALHSHSTIDTERFNIYVLNIYIYKRKAFGLRNSWVAGLFYAFRVILNVRVPLCISFCVAFEYEHEKSTKTHQIDKKIVIIN